MPSVVLPGLAERFRREGYVVIPDVFTPAELDIHAGAVDRFMRATMPADCRTQDGKDCLERSFVERSYLWASDVDVRALSCHPRLANIAAVLLGTAAVRMWHDRAMYKRPGGHWSVPHQDHPHWPLVETDQVTAWIPFEAADRNNGTVAYYPGSHRLGLDRFIDLGGDEIPDDLGADPALRGVHPVMVEVPVGSVAFHHGLTAHFSLANQSDAIRRVHTVVYLADGCRRGGFRPHPCVELDGIGDGEKVDGSFTPVLWPRPDGDLPEPPSDADARLDQFWRHVYGRSRQAG